MADIICIECKTNVSDASGYCPECGYPFDTAPPGLNSEIVGGTQIVQQEDTNTPSLDMVYDTLNSVRMEMNELQKAVTELKQDFSSHSLLAETNTQKMLAELSIKLDTIASATESVQSSKKGLLAAFYRTLNSPNSMFEYMFYICVAQIVFVVVSLFLIAYIVTLIR